MKKLLFSFFSFLILLLFVSCPDGGGSSSNDLIFNQDNFLAESSSEPYLDILNSKICNTTSQMEYSLDNGSTWADCVGSIQDVTLNVADHVIVREIADTSWTRDLGTVTALSGLSDFYSGNRIYVGDAYDINTSSYWDDDAFFSYGDDYDIYTILNNLGDNTASNVKVNYYIYSDKLIDSSDTLLLSYTTSSVALGDFDYFSKTSNPTFPDLAPGQYYIGAIIDPDNTINELNEGNNTTLPEDTAPVFITSGDGLDSGAFKLVNSWGKGGSWEHKSDGHYWMGYDDMIANKMGIWFYFNDVDTVYEPKALAVFNVTHAHRNEMRITVGLGDYGDPYLSKTFETLISDNTPAGGDPAFPSHDLVLDITEFAPYLNDYNLYLLVENIGSTTGYLNKFTLELYDDYSASAINSISSSQKGSLSGGITGVSYISTKGNISSTQLTAISETGSLTSSGSSLVLSELADSEIDSLLEKYGEPQDNNTLILGQYGTGWIPPSRDDWEDMYILDSVETATTRSGTFNGTSLPLSVDHSISQYFPPIGNQGSEGSCVAFSTAYYIHTFMEAQEHGWDLSGVSWGTDSLGLSDGGSPNSSLDKIFSPDFVYHQINDGVDGGSSYTLAVETLRRQGCATWDTMPYDTDDSTTWPTEEAYREAAEYRGNTMGHFYWTKYKVGFFYLEDDADIQLLKSLLSMGYIVTTGIYAGDGSASDLGLYDHLDSNDVFQSGYTWSTTNHAQTIVGYKEGTEWDSSNPDA